MQKIFTLIIASFFFAAVSAQVPHKIIADKIVAIVGDKIILQSDIYNDIQDRKRHGEVVPGGDDCQIMEQFLVLKGLVLQAQKDSLVVDEEELENLLDNQVRGFIRIYGSREELEKIAGRSVYQIKEDLRQSFKERLLADRMQDKITGNLKVTPEEVNKYFSKIPKDSIPFLESQIEIGEIIVYPKASRDLEKLTIDELNEYKGQAESGQQKFEILAKLYSKDSASRDNGGLCMINRSEKYRGTTFIDNAFRLKEGQISPVFKSTSGYHIIQMISRAGDDAEVRHILRIPAITEVEINEAITRLDSVRARLIAGTITFGEAVRKYSEDVNAKFTAGICQLDKDLVELLAKTNLKTGEFSHPAPFKDQNKKEGLRIVYMKSRTQPHRMNLKDDYDRIARQALEVKKQLALEAWFAAKIPTFYIMIDNFKDCGNLGRWMQYATTNK